MQSKITPASKSLIQGKSRIIQALDQETYRFERYHVPFCLAAISTQNSKHLQSIRRNLRKTDILIPLSKNCACIALASTEIDDAIKMGENFIREHDTFNSHNRIYIGVTSVKHTQSNYDIVSRAFYALDKAQESNISTVEDDYILGE